MDKAYNRINEFFKDLSAELKQRGFLQKKIFDEEDQILAQYSNNNNDKSLLIALYKDFSSEKKGRVMANFKKDGNMMAQMPWRPKITADFINNGFNLWYSVPYEILVNKITDVVDICKHL